MKNNIDPDHVKKLKADASKRYYYRVLGNKNKQLIMDSSKEIEMFMNFTKVSRWLETREYSVPKIYNKDKKNGYMIIEDFGNLSFREIFLIKSNFKYKVYLETCKLLSHLAKEKPASFLKHYSWLIFKEELNIFLDWGLFSPKEKKKEAVKNWNMIWKDLYKNIYSKSEVSTVLRDFHIDNLFYLKDRKNIKKIGLIDFQDALAGHSCYDLVSLLQDVRTFIPFTKQESLLKHYLKLSKNSPNEFKKAYFTFGSQRAFKIIGIFKRLKYKYNNDNYIKYLPRCWKIINYNLKKPFLSDLKYWVDCYLKKNI